MDHEVVQCNEHQCQDLIQEDGQTHTILTQEDDGQPHTFLIVIGVIILVCATAVGWLVYLRKKGYTHFSISTNGIQLITKQPSTK